MLGDHIAPWQTESQGHLSPDANNDLKTDYSKWRLLDDDGRQTWHYLESDEENKKWPQSIADKYFLGLPTVILSCSYYIKF
jgi:lanosterol synthase